MSDYIPISDGQVGEVYLTRKGMPLRIVRFRHGEGGLVQYAVVDSLVTGHEIVVDADVPVLPDTDRSVVIAPDEEETALGRFRMLIRTIVTQSRLSVSDIADLTPLDVASVQKELDSLLSSPPVEENRG